MTSSTIGYGFSRASVTKVSLGAGTVSVKIPALNGNVTFDNVPFYGDNPSVNDDIIVGYLEGLKATPIAISIAGGSSLPTSAAEGDIEGVTAGLGLSGGGTTGTVSLAFAPSELSSVTVATDDKVVIADTSDSDNPKHVTAQSLANLASVSPAGSDTQVQFNNSGSFGASSNMVFDGTNLDIAGLKIGGTAVTSTAAELNLVDGITAGTVSASLAVIVDSNKDITGFRNVTLTGELDAATLDISGDADIDGTTNLDVVDIDGAVDMASTLNVATSVGIGTTSPVGQLSVDSQNRQISIIDSGTVNYAEIRAHAVDSATSYANVNYNAYSHNFVVSGSRKLYIDNNGDVLPDQDSDIDLGNGSRFFAKAYIDEISIGSTTGPILTKGDNNTLRIETGDGFLDIGAQTSSSVHIYGENTYLFLGTDDTARIGLQSTAFYPNSNGTIQLGKSGKVWDKFWLDQADQFSSGGYYTLRSRDDDRQVMELVSSERFKKDIVDLPLSEAYKVLDARVIKYRGADDDSSVPLEVGLSAESLHNAGYEYAVRYDEGHWGTTPRSIYYEYLTAPLIAIIRDLKTRLEALES